MVDYYTTMPEFAKGLKLEVTNRDEFEQFILDNAHDPGATMENWGENSVPEAVYVSYYQDDDDAPFYKTHDQHVNGVLTWNYWSEELLEDAIEAGLLENTEEYNVELVEEQEAEE